MYADLVQEVDPRYRIVGVEEVELTSTDVDMDMDDIIIVEQPRQQPTGPRNGRAQQQRNYSQGHQQQIHPQQPFKPLNQRFGIPQSTPSLAQRMGGAVLSTGNGNGNGKGKKSTSSLLNRLG
jgi:hypothetical protein